MERDRHLFHQNQLLERIARNEPIHELLQAIRDNLAEETACMCAIQVYDDTIDWGGNSPQIPVKEGWQLVWARPVFSTDGRERGMMTVYSRSQAISVEATEQIFEAYLNLAGLAMSRQFYEKEIRQLAYQDPLTSLPNRRLINERIAFALQQASETGNSVGLLMLDLAPLQNGQRSVRAYVRR